MKQFGDANRQNKRRNEDDYKPPVEVGILDRPVMINYPGTSQVAYLGTLMLGSELEMAGGLINFVAGLMPGDEDRNHLKRCLLDHESGFDIYDLVDVMTYCTEQWADGSPTVAASGSSPTQQPTGKRSTANSRRVVSTRSTSPSTVS